MSPTKRFLTGFAVFYLVIALGLVFTLGPPGYSSEYLDNYKEQQDRYTEIVKSEGYKAYLEYKAHPGRPNPAEDNPELQAKIAFVERHEKLEAFQAETRRRAIFDTLFDFFNAGAVIVLIVRFGKKPLLQFLDGQIAQIRAKIERAEQARAAAGERRAEAQTKVDALEAEKAGLAEHAKEQIARTKEEIEESTAHGIRQLDEEKEDRKSLEDRRAALQVKQELVERAIALLTERCKAEASAESQAVLIDQFVHGVENRS